MRWLINSSYRNNSRLHEFEYLNTDTANAAITYHKTLEDYHPTPLVSLKNLAAQWGLKNIYVKDESKRLKLKAFKVLGASYAIKQILDQKVELEADHQTECVAELKPTEIFVSATDGNHGRAVAWAARKFAQQAIIYMPKNSAESRISAIRAEGAKVKVTNYNYDKTAEIIAQRAYDNGWILIQDSSWNEYLEIPKCIMQGYLTMALEIEEELQKNQLELPTHVVLQAGVGSFPAAIVNYWHKTLGHKCPIFIIVESDQANCFYESVKNNKKQIVDGPLDTVMSGLACGKPSLLAWDILRTQAHCFIACPDEIALIAMNILNNPISGDASIESGESGAISIGVLDKLLHDPDYTELKRKLDINHHSRVLCFNTEGITNPERNDES
jgi:diaminopropionate ammonia-lyase